MECKTVVLSKFPASAQAGTVFPGMEAAECAEFEDKLTARLIAEGFAVLAVPHLYFLTSSHQAVERISELEGDVILCSWLHPRAAFWTLAALGLDFAAPEDNAEGDRRRIECLWLGSFQSIDEALDHVGGLCAEPRDKGALEDVSSDEAPRWYPVLDYSRCSGCRQCLNFCLFGVYALRDGRVTAVEPDNCKAGCPACARVCPAQAIMFPHFPGDESIAGRSETVCECESGSGDCVCNTRACAANGKQSADGLDRLIDALDEMDE